MNSGESAPTRTAKARTIRKRQADTSTLEMSEQKADRAREMMIERRSKPESIAEKIAGDKLYYRNHYYPGYRVEFPNEPRLQTVDRYYPYAQGGALYIDEPRLPHEIDQCRRKKAAMARLGLRYLVIMPEMSFEDALRELGL